MVFTSAENFDQYYWDLENPHFPLYEDPGFFMTVSMSPCYLFPGVFISSDENYA